MANLDLVKTKTSKLGDVKNKLKKIKEDVTLKEQDIEFGVLKTLSKKVPEVGWLLSKPHWTPDEELRIQQKVRELQIERAIELEERNCRQYGKDLARQAKRDMLSGKLATIKAKAMKLILGTPPQFPGGKGKGPPLNEAQPCCQICEPVTEQHFAPEEPEVGQVYEMIIHEIQAQRLELRQMMNRFREKDLQRKYMRERSGWCEWCLKHVKLPTIDPLAPLVEPRRVCHPDCHADTPSTEALQVFDEYERKEGMRRLLNLDDWQIIEEQLSFIETKGFDGKKEEEDEVVEEKEDEDEDKNKGGINDRNYTYEFYPLGVGTTPHSQCARYNWRRKYRRDHRCERNYWLNREQAAMVELGVTLKALKGGSGVKMGD